MTDSAKRPLLRRVLGKARRTTKQAILGGDGGLDQRQLDDLWHWVNGMQDSVNQLTNQISGLNQRTDTHANETAEHTDLVVDQLWRRLEAADARLATYVQGFSQTTKRQIADLDDLGARLKTENSAILRLIGHEEMVTADDAVRSATPVALMTLFSEVERGSSDVLLAKLSQYVPYFEDADGPVIDIGCGKGDFLELAVAAGVKAYGVDLDQDAVDQATERNLDARLEDLFVHLAALPANSLGGAFSSQVVEHLPPATIYKMYEELYRVVKPGGRVVVETPNPATFATHVQSFWRDPTHIRPVPLPSLDFAARHAGFVSEQTVYASPSPESDRLEPITLEPQDPLMEEFAMRFNANVEKLNDLLYGWQDYALVARKA